MFATPKYTPSLLARIPGDNNPGSLPGLSNKTKKRLITRKFLRPNSDASLKKYAVAVTAWAAKRPIYLMRANGAAEFRHSFASPNDHAHRIWLWAKTLREPILCACELLPR